MIFLIAHKVRGEPAFDIAEQMPVGDEIWWIIPTSGHRAYPFWHRVLEDQMPEMPEGVPDHYRCHSAVESAVKSIEINLKELGLL